MLHWDVAVYAPADEARLRACLDSVARSLEGVRARIAVILNGKGDAGAEVARRAARDGLPVETYRIPAADPSNAINQFIYHIRRPAQAVARVDGEAQVAPAAFPAMLARLRDSPGIVAASGVHGDGRTAAAPQLHGTLHGALHALRGSFIDRMVDQRIRLPIGIHGAESLLCSMAAHDLDSLNQPWMDGRIATVADATFTLPPGRPGDLRRRYASRIRQMTGRLQAAAIQDVIDRDGFHALPDHADEMVRQFLAANPPPPARGLDRWFQRLAVRQLRTIVPIDPLTLMPERVTL